MGKIVAAVIAFMSFFFGLSVGGFGAGIVFALFMGGMSWIAFGRNGKPKMQTQTGSSLGANQHHEKRICEKCKCEYEIISKVWVGKRLCKKCQTEEVKKFDDGWGNIIRVAFMALLVIFVISLILPSSCTSNNGQDPADIYYRR